MNRIFFLLIFFFPINSFAQYAYQTADFGVGKGNNNHLSGMASYTKMFAIGKKQAFRMGYGLRLTTLVGKESDYQTAPADLTTGKSSLMSLFAERINSQIDTLRVKNANTNAINISFNVQYAFTKKIEMGINFDVVGITFGDMKTGTYLAQQSDATGKKNTGKAQSALPTMFNLRLLGDSDMGSLTAEVYVRYWFSKRWGMRAGMSHQTSEYKTNDKLGFANDRFRLAQTIPYVAISARFR
jgi:hypothetical protein